MRTKKILVLTVVMFWFSTIAALASDKCIMCGMDAQKSETKFVIQLSQGAKEMPAGEYAFCCLRCLVILTHKIDKEKISSILARDYIDTKSMIEAKKGFYLVESQKHPKGSMVPFMLIFSKMDDAKKFKKEFGGRILNWKEVWKYVESR